VPGRLLKLASNNQMTLMGKSIPGNPSRERGKVGARRSSRWNMAPEFFCPKSPAMPAGPVGKNGISSVKALKVSEFCSRTC